jgi:hypothetical protein
MLKRSLLVLVVLAAACETSTTVSASVRLSRPLSRDCIAQTARDLFGSGSVRETGRTIGVNLATDPKKSEFANVQQEPTNDQVTLDVSLAWWGQKSRNRASEVQQKEVMFLKKVISSCETGQKAIEVECLMSFGRRVEMRVPALSWRS